MIMKKGCKSGVKKKRGYAAGGMITEAITEAAQSTMAPSKSRKRKPQKSSRK